MTDRAGPPVRDELVTQANYRLVEALAESERRYRSLLESLGEILVECRPDGEITLVNPAWECFLGHDLRTTVGMSLVDFVHPDDRELARELIEKGPSAKREIRFVKSDRTELWAVPYTVMRLRDGERLLFSFLDVTERHLADERASQDRERFRLMADAAPVLLFLADAHGAIGYVNSRWLAFGGRTLEQEVGDGWLASVHPSDVKRVTEVVRGAVGLKNPYSVEHRLKRRAGDYRWMLTTAVPHRGADGAVLGYVGTAIDIHERKLMEQRLLESEERFALFAKASNDGVWIRDLATDRLFLSTRWLAMLGCDEGEIPSTFEAVSARMHPDDRDATTAKLVAYLAGNEPVYENVARMRHRDGHWVWQFTRGVLVRNAEGKPTRMVGSTTDITRIKAAEEAILRREQELDAVVDHSPTGVVALDPEGRVVIVNSAFTRLTGLARDELVGVDLAGFAEKLEGLAARPVFYADPYATVDHDAPIARDLLIGVAPASGVRSPGELSDRIQIERPERRTLQRTVRSVPGDRIGTVMYFRDMTVEATIEQMKSDFIATAAHELRTPMTAVRGYAEILLKREFSPEAVREMVEIIHEQSLVVGTMLDELLDLARIEARAGRDFRMREVPLVATVRAGIDDFAASGATPPIGDALPESAVMVRVDPAKLRQCVGNLLSNAVKYSPRGGAIGVGLRERAGAKGPEVGVYVADHGVGMTPEQKRRIFERFYRADASGKIPGSGLGMCLVKEIIEIMGGTVEIESTFGKGSEITLWLPIAQPAAKTGEA